MLRRRPLFRLELPDGFRLRDGLGSNPVEVQMSSSDSLPRLFMWFASWFVDVSVPVRQVKLPLVAHSILSRARPGSMVGAALNERSADRFVETFWYGVSQLLFTRPFLCTQVGTSLKPGKGSFHSNILQSHLAGLFGIRPP